MILTPFQMDALTELMNIATGRAAASLSGILRQHVRLQVVVVRALDALEINRFLADEIGDIGSVIEQKFSGGLTGNSLLVMTRADAGALVDTLLQANRDLANLTSTEQAILAEVGNVVLNACVAMLATQTGRRLHFGLPRVSLDVQGAQLAADLTAAWDEHVEGLVMKSHLLVGKTEATIYVLILLTMEAHSIQSLIDEALKGVTG